MHYFLNKIKDLVIYEKALKIYEKKQIMDCTIDEFTGKNGEILYKMEGIIALDKKIFTPVIDFDSDEIIDYSCNCNHKGELCPHIAALFFEAEDFIKKEYKLLELLGLSDKKSCFDKKSQTLNYDKVFLEYFPEKTSEKNIITLKIEPLIKYDGYYNELKFDISLVSNNKKYKLNNKLGDFLICYNNAFMKFGKFYTYNPHTDEFQGWDKIFIETLQGFYSLLNYVNIPLEVFLSTSIVAEKILQLLEMHPDFHIEENSLKNLLELEIKIARENTVLIASDNINSIDPVGYSFVYREIAGTSYIYHVGSEDVENLTKLKGAYLDSELGLEISEELFFKKASLLSSFSKLSLCKELQEKIYIPKEIKGAVYIDEDIGSNIAVSFKKIYDGIPEDEIQKLIIINSEIDSDFIQLMSLYTHYKNGKKFILFNEEDIFNFITKIIPKLQEKYDIFYSEKLKKRKYKNLSYNLFARINNFLEISFSVEDIPNDELKALMNSIKNRKKYFTLKDGGILNIEQGTEFEKIIELLEICQVTSKELQSGKIIRDKNYGYFIANIIKKIESASFDKEIVAMQKDLKKLKEKTGNNNLFKNFPMLRDYQQKGVQWLLFLKQMGLGGILADDMGLGKTLQIIAYLSLVEKSDKINLIIVPKTLLYNWQSEFKKFAPHMSIKLVDGNPNVRKYIIEDAEAGDTLITTYGMVSRDIELYEKKDIDIIVIDEAQNIKNFMAKTTTFVKKLKADIKIALTGTPIENNTLELWSIFDFIFPGYLGKHSAFKNKYAENFEELRELVSPFILRRTKKMVLKELPEKIENTIEVELESTQKKLYQTYLTKYKENIFGENESSIELLACLTRLRQICNHPKLFIEDYKGKSSKLEALLLLLKNCQSGGNRVLIFSQFTEMLKLIIKELPEDMDYLYLDGNTKTEERMKLVEKFNNGTAELFLISLKAGGSGLNLTGADTVIHFDPWWNPSIEEQASDRAHRMGQDKIVNVYRLIARGTIEEKIEAIKKEKKELIKEVIEGERRDLLSMTKQDILDLLMKK